jgi:HPt (histidine-containing phosphotransfer) domain-containing protein
MLDRCVEAPSPARERSAGAGCERPIDLVHLARMTFGDRDLEHEVLQLFVRQAAGLVAQMRDSPDSKLAALAHTLKGSARGIGAWRVAEAAESLELAAAGAADSRSASLTRVAATVAEAESFIRALLPSS